MDSFTLVVASALVAGINAASMLLLYQASSRQRCLLDWSLGGLCFMASNVIGALALKLHPDDVLAPAIANTLYIAGHAGINLGVAWLLWRQPDAGARPAYLPLMVLELLFMAQMGLRALYLLASTDGMPAFTGDRFLQASGALFVLVFLSVATMACALIVTHQQELALRRASLTDVLTGWLNRRALHDIAGREFRRCQRTGTPLFFITFDIDHFKSINDRYGHGVGDAAICHVTALAGRALRGHDALFRIGGEEFAVLVNGGSLADLQGIAQRLRELVAATPLLAQGAAVPMTVSVGLAATAAADGQWEDVLRRADEAMYHAKQNGRNRVGVHGVDVGMRAQPHSRAA